MFGNKATLEAQAQDKIEFTSKYVGCLERVISHEFNPMDIQSATKILLADLGYSEEDAYSAPIQAYRMLETEFQKAVMSTYDRVLYNAVFMAFLTTSMTLIEKKQIDEAIKNEVRKNLHKQ